MFVNPFFHTGLSISDSLKTVRKSVLIYETIISFDISPNKICKMDYKKIHLTVSAPRDTVWLYYHISAILKTIKYCRKRPEAPHLFPGYSFGSILLEDFLPRASVLPAAPDDTGDPVPAYA